MFKQLFDTESSTYTYFIIDEASKQALLIDPVASQVDLYLDLLKNTQGKLKYTLETHVHADHITASGQLREKLDAQTGVGALCGAATADLQLKNNDILTFGQQSIKVIATPGHTPGSVSYLWHDRVFTGDALLINGCGRTDFQGGDAGTVFDSITHHIFSLPDETLVYPGHDYHGKRVSCVGQEKTLNPRLVNQSRITFIAMMAALNLPKPKMIDIAVPLNRRCGITEETIQQG